MVVAEQDSGPAVHCAVIDRVPSILEAIVHRYGWHAHFELRAFTRMRLDGKPPMDELYSFAHADEAERAVRVHRLRIEADAVIGNGKPKHFSSIASSTVAPPLYLTTLCSASCLL